MIMRIDRTLFGFVATVLIVLGAATPALAGHERHGGGVMVCPDGAVELYDFVEAAIPLPGRKPVVAIRSDAPVQKQIDVALGKLSSLVSKAFANEVRTALDRAREVVVKVPVGYSIPKPDDVKDALVRTGCWIEGVALYRDWSAEEEEQLLLDPRLFAKLPKTDQAALWIHEALYKVFRDTQRIEDSRKVRPVVATLFASPTRARLLGVLPTYTILEGNSGEIWLHANAIPRAMWIQPEYPECEIPRRPVVTAESMNRQWETSEDAPNLVGIDLGGNGHYEVFVHSGYPPGSLKAVCQPSLQIFDAYLRPVAKVRLSLGYKLRILLFP